MFWRRRRRERSRRMMILELAVAVRYASSRLGLAVNRVRNTYMRTGDPSLLTILEGLLHAQTVLEILALRLETLAAIGTLVGDDLGVIRGVLARLRDEYAGLQPMLDSVLSELENAAASVAAEAGIEAPPTVEGTHLSEQVSSILEEAKAVADTRLQEVLGNKGSR